MTQRASRRRDTASPRTAVIWSFQWNYGDIIEAIEAVTPSDQAALVHGERTITWGEMKRRTNNLAKNLIASGVEPSNKIAFYMRNCPEYSEGINAGFKLEENELRDFSRGHLAAYKIPKRILSKDDLERAPNGKADYKTIQAFAQEQLASQ